MSKSNEKIVLSVIVHQTPAALRFGGDGYFITFAGTDFDKAEAAKLTLLNNVALKVTIEVE